MIPHIDRTIGSRHTEGVGEAETTIQRLFDKAGSFLELSRNRATFQAVLENLMVLGLDKGCDKR